VDQLHLRLVRFCIGEARQLIIQQILVDEHIRADCRAGTPSCRVKTPSFSQNSPSSGLWFQLLTSRLLNVTNSDNRSSSNPKICSSSTNPTLLTPRFHLHVSQGPWFGLVWFDSILIPIILALQESCPRFQHLSCRRVRPRRALHRSRLVRCRHHRNPPVRCVQNAS
jgi:hypothetical protein